MSIIAKIKHKKVFTAFICVVVIVAISAGCCAVYLGDYYKARLGDTAVFSAEGLVNEVQLQNGVIVFEPQNPVAGFIFYPGGKVEYTAYKPLMQACAQRGVLCVLVEMPFNLAVFDVNAADGICEGYPQINNWYIGGHSLGGSMAASYLSENISDFNGLVLLGSYSTVDLSQSDLNVLSVYGSQDKVMNRENYDENIGNLPEDFTEYIIDGGCHSYFGMYGEQEGDGTPGISNQDQIQITANEIYAFISGG